MTTHLPSRRSSDVNDGPSLASYIEVRLGLIQDSIKEKEQANRDSLLAVVEASKLAQSAIKDAQVANDLRYQQRFEAQSDALAAAFLAQQTAMQTALTVAEKAVQAALAAAERATSKAELAADKRFESLGELREMLGKLITRVEADQQFKGLAEKIVAVEARLNTTAGEDTGSRRSTNDSKSLVALGISILAIIIGALTFLFARLGP